MENVTMQSALMNVTTLNQGGELAFLEGQEELFQQLLERMFQQPAETEENLVKEDLPAQEPAESESFDESVFQALQYFLRFPPPLNEPVQGAKTEELVKSAATLPPVPPERVMLQEAILVEEDLPETEPAEVKAFDESVFQALQHSLHFPPPLNERVQVETTKITVFDKSAVPLEIDIKDSEPEAAELKPVQKEMSQTTASPITLPPTEVIQATPTATPQVEKLEIAWQQPEPFVQKVGQTIEVSLHKMQTNEVKVVQVKLTPETFGEIEIHLEWKGDRVEAKIYVQEEEVKQVLEERMPKLLEQLPAEPIVRHITVELLPQPVFQPFAGEFGSRKQVNTSLGKANHRADNAAEEDAEELDESTYQIDGLSLYI